VQTSRLALALSSALLIVPALHSQTYSGPGCVVETGYYDCDQAAFKAALKEARTIAVESRPFDQATTNSLKKLAHALNKTEQSSSPDLTFVLIRTDAEGIFFGPSDRELASLLVYSRNPENEKNHLIWIETFYGEPDLVWPIVVYDTIQQFKVSIR
jgi:hypothetical protein